VGGDAASLPRSSQGPKRHFARNPTHHPHYSWQRVVSEDSDGSTGPRKGIREPS